MKTRFHACLWVLILLLVQPAFSWASATFIPPVPTDTGQTEIYLLTRGAGDEAYMKYGHTMIRVVDPSHNLDVAYNWGMFDFRTPGFIVKFLRGLLLYHLDISPTRYEVGVSQSEHRWLVQERLNLTDKQKADLLVELNREAQPDRRYYRYLFFTDNCSTRPRDVLDRALAEKIAARFKGKPSGSTFRDEVMKYNASAPILAMGQDVILNGEVDRGISQWEEMFVPLKLREYLLSMPAYNDDGTERPGEKLLTATTTLVSYPDPVSSPYSGYAVVWLLLGIPMLAGMALYARPAFRELGIRIFGLILAVWGAVSGGFGLYLALSWAFSEHTVVWNNANLRIFWPVDWYLFVPAAVLLWKGTTLREGSLLAKLTVWFALGHIASLGFYAILAIGGYITQYVTRVLVYYGSLTLLVYSMTLYLSGFRWWVRPGAPPPAPGDRRGEGPEALRHFSHSHPSHKQ